MMTTTLFFDLDSTLVENQFSRKAIRELLREIADESETSIEQLGREMWRINWERQQNDPDHPLTMDWNDIVQTLAARYGVMLTNDVDTLWNQYADIDDVTILDHAPQVLADLKSRGYQIVLATKGLYKYQAPVLRVTGLDQYLDDILTPDRTQYLKTSPEYFAAYQDSDNLLIQIGDHCYDDVICARRNGFYAILRAPIAALADYDAFERPQYLPEYQDDISTYPADATPEPTAVVISLEELPDVIERIEALHDTNTA